MSLFVEVHQQRHPTSAKTSILIRGYKNGSAALPPARFVPSVTLIEPSVAKIDPSHASEDRLQEDYRRCKSL